MSRSGWGVLLQVNELEPMNYLLGVTPHPNPSPIGRESPLLVLVRPQSDPTRNFQKSLCLSGSPFLSAFHRLLISSLITPRPSGPEAGPCLARSKQKRTDISRRSTWCRDRGEGRPGRYSVFTLTFSFLHEKQWNDLKEKKLKYSAVSTFQFLFFPRGSWVG